MARNTVKLKKYVDIIIERKALETVYPGQLVKVNADDTVSAHDVEGGVAAVLLALEDELQGRGLDWERYAYTAGQPVQVWCAVPGEVANVEVPPTVTIERGNYLASDGLGGFKVAEAGENVVGMAMEAWDGTAEGTYGYIPMMVCTGVQISESESGS